LSEAIERQRERGTPPDQNVIVSGSHARRIRQSDDFAQTAADPIAFDRIADPLRNRKPDARLATIFTCARLQDECRCGNSDPGSGRQKIRPLPQPFHGKTSARAADQYQALSRLRPRARRAFKTLRPPIVAMRARKPCRRLRTSLLG
jgi:hypothetical protein